MKGASFPADSSRQTRRSNPAACSCQAAQAGPQRFGLCAFSAETTAASAQAAAGSGLRASAFFRPSALGFRISNATSLPTGSTRGERRP
jgi:hypothetical protein